MPSKTLIGVSLVGHLALFTGMFVYNTWDIDQLEYRQRTELRIGVQPPPPAESSGAREKTAVTRKKPPPPRDLVQIDRRKIVIDKPPPPPTPTPDDAEDDNTKGPGTGQTGVVCTSNCTGTTSEPVVPEVKVPKIEVPKCPGDPSCPPANIRLDVMRALRTHGETIIMPPPAVQQEMVRDGVDQTEGAIRFCIAINGAVSSATVFRPTKYPDYDAALVAGVRRWQHSPHRVNGKPTPACSVVTFKYRMR